MPTPYRVILNPSGIAGDIIRADVWDVGYAFAFIVPYYMNASIPSLGAYLLIVDKPGTQGSEDLHKWEYKLNGGTKPRWVKVK